jgi:hypothetical protein
MLIPKRLNPGGFLPSAIAFDKFARASEARSFAQRQATAVRSPRTPSIGWEGAKRIGSDLEGLPSQFSGSVPGMLEPRDQNNSCQMWNTKTGLPVHTIMYVGKIAYCQPTHGRMADVIACARCP